MSSSAQSGWLASGMFLFILQCPTLASAQIFTSGSTGADGAFAPTANTTLALPSDGIFNFTTVDIPTGVTVTFTPNATRTAVTILATSDVTIEGTKDINGAPGLPSATDGPPVLSGGNGGPGGFRGGQGGARGDGNNTPSVGEGPGGGRLPDFPPPQFGGGGKGGTYGISSTVTSLLPLFGGSGGGGQRGNSTRSGSSGGGGGGAILIGSDTKIAVTGTITANGGEGGSALTLTVLTAGGGSGGAIRLVAPEVTGAGTLSAKGGNPGVGVGGPGLIRLESNPQGLSITGTIVPSNLTPIISFPPGPVTAASNPALINLPTLKISSVGGLAIPTDPAGTFTSADLTLPDGTTNPVPVTVTATNTPVPTTFTIKLIPQFADTTTFTAVSSTQTGTFASSTASANVIFPSGFVSVLNAFAEFDLPIQIAALFPPIDGEPVDYIMVAATYGGPSTLSLITRSGKELRVDQLPLKERHAVAQGLAALRQPE